VSLFVMMAVLAVGLVSLAAWQRRRPGTWLARWAWLVRAVAAGPYLALGSGSYGRGERVAGGIYVASGLALLAFGAIERWLEGDGRR